jgi:prophage regulatory protein
MTTTQSAFPSTCNDLASSSGDRILRLPRILELTGLSRSSIYARIGDGTFPPSVALGPRSVGWLQSDVWSWIDERVAASRNEVLQ